jgi:hypothetical protein
VREDLVTFGRLGLRVAIAVGFVLVVAAAGGLAYRVFRLVGGLG